MASAACSVSDMHDMPETDNGNNDSVIQVPAGAKQGRIIVKMRNPIVDTKSADVFSFLGPCTVTRTFPDAGKFEARHRKYGLDRWYTIDFDSGYSLTKAAGNVMEIEGVEHVDFDFRIKPADMPFNDPMLPEQWHYFNDGSRDFSTAGSDVNVFPAWEITTGAPEVIVAVCDSGVDWDHEDLAANMWVNEAELNGEQGVDDDENGYIDDIHGYNFVSAGAGTAMVGSIQPDDHGTHVAGTIAAVNNNSIGVAGLAGGDGTGKTGVKVMTVQTIGSNGGYIGAAMVYAADMGAVLMNCSWGLDEVTSTPAYIVEAIEYFNEVAGQDAEGNQTGPMAGGVMFFASGNDNRDVTYPAMEENVCAVSALGADFVKANYSNYGDWVDFAAPGGDAAKGNLVTSTIVGGYGTMQGTSMACPHVTGVAALAVSHFMGDGFTRDNLIHVLNQTSSPDFYKVNQGFVGELGVGLVDAYAALTYKEPVMKPVNDFSGETNSNRITLNWTIPGESGANAPYRFRIFESAGSLADLDAGNPGENVTVRDVNPGNRRAGDAMTLRLENLPFEKEYHFRIAEMDFAGVCSELSEEVVLTTPANNPPVIEAVTDYSVKIRAFETVTMKFKVYDADGHDISYTLKGLPSMAVKHVLTGSELMVMFDATQVTPGSVYTGKLTVSDTYSETELTLTFEVLENTAPYATAAMGDIVLNSVGSRLEAPVNLLDHFKDDDGDPLTYTFSLSPSTQIAKFELTDDILDVVAFSYGTAKLTITASDAHGEKASLTLNLLVRDGSHNIDVYPNPVVRELNLRSPEPMKADIRISSKSGAVVLEEDGAEFGPFSPKVLDLGGLSGGMYYVSISNDGFNETYSIHKK